MKCNSWEISGYDRDVAVNLFRRGINSLVAVILASRGVSSDEEVESIIRDNVSLVADPFLLKDMDKAVNRLRRVIENKEHIAIYGDYDVDGITSTCLLASYFRTKGARCQIYIPERLEEGYGVNNKALDALSALGVSLIITVDCGVTAINETEYAKKLGMEMIITDHHECGKLLPDAVAVINPKRTDCDYPDKRLAGVGVAFKLVCALEGAEHTQALLKTYGDLLATGTIADVVPVLGENRVFIRRGIEALRCGARPGLRKLCEAAGIERKQITDISIGYILTPRLNAAGRLGKAMLAVDLLLTRNDAEAEKLAAEICEMNNCRKQLESDMLEEAVSELEASPPEGAPIVLAKEDWHQGVAGIVASRIAEKYNLPAIIICLTDEAGKGSCRSIEGFNMYNALQDSGDLLESFGGHELAAGLTISAENIPLFKAKLAQFYKSNARNTCAPVLKIDFEMVRPGLLTTENVTSLSDLEPYGSGNPQPVLCIMEAEIQMIFPLCGGKHTKIWIYKSGETFECIYFSKSVSELKIKVGDSVDLAFIPQINEFKGRRTVQLLLSDLNVHE